MLTALVAAVLSSLFTASLIRIGAVHREIASHDHQISELNEDLRRWIRDRDRQRKHELAEVINQNAAAGTLYGGSAITGLKVRAEIVRHEWRDEASRVLREFTRIVDAEGRLHELLRRRSGDRPGLKLPDDIRTLLFEWQAPIEKPGEPGLYTPLDDPADRELEPEIAALEKSGAKAFPSLSLLTGTARAPELAGDHLRV